MKEKKAIFINTASQVIVRFVTLIFALISTKLITNYLGPTGTGEYNTIITYISFFIVFADLGLFSVTVREIARTPEREKAILSNVFVVRLITAIIVTTIAAGLILLTNYDLNLKIGVLVASVYILFNLMSSVYDMILQTRLKMQFSALAEFLSKLIALIALFLIIRSHGDFIWVVSTITLTAASVLVIKWIFAKRYICFSPGYDRKIASWIFSLAWPMGIVFILNNLFFKIDSLILFIIKGASEAGIYSVAYKVLEVTVFVGAYFASSLKPIISRNILTNKTYVSNIINKSFLVMLLFSLPIAVASAIYAKNIIIMLSNEQFISGSRALIILVFTLPFVYLDTLLGEILIANDERKFLTRSAIFIVSFNIITNLIFIPHYSFMGAAGTTLASEFVLFVVSYCYVKRIIPCSFNLKKVFQIVFISILTLVISLLLKTTGYNFIVLVFISFLVYGILAYLFGIVTWKSFRDMFSE